MTAIGPTKGAVSSSLAQLDTPEMAAEVSTGRRMYIRVRADASRSIAGFLKTPLAWVLLAGLIATTWWYTTIRTGNYLSCAYTSITMDQQTFRDIVAGPANGVPGGPQFERACAGLVLPGPNWAKK